MLAVRFCLAKNGCKQFIRFLATGTNAAEALLQPNIVNKLREKFQTDIQNKFVVPIFKKALLYDEQIAIKDSAGEYSYIQLYLSSKKLSYQISNICGSGASMNVAYFCPKNVLSIVVQWACWISGQVAMPLNSGHSHEMLKYFVKDSDAMLLIATPENEKIAEELASQLNLALLIIDHTFLTSKNDLSQYEKKIVLQMKDTVLIEGTLSNDFYTHSRALLLYSSCTTGKPKGIMISHKNIEAQINSLTNAWKICSTDSFLNVLPLHHINGCINALHVPLSVGAKVIMQDDYNSHNVWSTLLGINLPLKGRINVFMAVPTIYNQLIVEYDKIFMKNSQMVKHIKNYCTENIRLMVSSSASLPIRIFKRWHEITDHHLLESYGMNEVGTALSNPYIVDEVSGKKRQAGFVGWPLPNVKVRIVHDDKVLFECEGKTENDLRQISSNFETTKLTKSGENIFGEIQIAGPNVFEEYYDRPLENKTAFKNGYFKTGDIASFEEGTFKILGRESMDIINTGGFIISSLEIESLLLDYPSIKDAVVVGVPDDFWGERVFAICTLKPGFELDIKSLKVFWSKFLPLHEQPASIKIVNEIPRNSMLKVNKRDIINEYLNDLKIQPMTN